MPSPSPMPGHQLPSARVCPTCGADRPGLFCGSCGEKVVSPREFGLWHFVQQAIGGLTTFDGKLFGSLRRLLFRPGELTRDWIRGARVRRLRPVQLFLLVNLLVFLADKWWSLPGLGSTSHVDGIKTWVEAMRAQAAELSMTYVDYRKLFDATSSGLARATVVILIPIAALVSLALNLFGDRRIGVHMVFATHAAAFFLLVPDLLIMDVISPWARHSVRLPTEVNSPLRNNLLLGLVLAVQCIWWYLASRRALGTGRVWAFVQAIVGPPLFFVAALISQQYIVFKLTMRALAQ